VTLRIVVKLVAAREYESRIQRERINVRAERLMKPRKATGIVGVT
jgi:hypothetical protein